MAKVIVAIKPSSSTGSSSITRYIAESKRDPEKENLKEREARPLFSRELDGLTHQQADELLAQGEGWFPESEEVIHLVISPEAESFESLGDTHDERMESFKDLIREAAEEIEKETGLEELRWVAGIHLNTDLPHAHVAISRHGIDRESNELVRIDHVPKTLLPHNERNEAGEKVFKPGLIAETVGQGIDIAIVCAQEQLPEQARQTEPEINAPAKEPLSEAGQLNNVGVEFLPDAHTPESQAVESEQAFIDPLAPDTSFGPTPEEPDTLFSPVPFENDYPVDRSDNLTRDREIIGQSMIARGESERLDRELTSLIEHGDKRRFRVFDATHGRTRQISEFDIQRRADTRAAAVVREREIVDPDKRHLARQVHYENELHAHDKGIRDHQIIVNKTIKKTARDLERVTADHAHLSAQVRALQTQYRARGLHMPTPLLPFHNLGRLQDQAVSNHDVKRFSTLENIRVSLAAEFQRPERTDKEIARLEGQVLNSRAEQAVRHERAYQFGRHKHQTRFEINNEKYSLSELDRQIAEHSNRSHLFSRNLKVIHFLPSQRRAAAAEVERLRGIRDVVVEKIEERSTQLQSSLKESIRMTETLAHVLSRQHEAQQVRQGTRLDKTLTRSEISHLVDCATTLSDPAMLNQAYLLEAQHQDRSDGKKMTTVEQAARALGRAVMSSMALRHAQERLATFQERRSYVPVVVTDLSGKEVTTRLGDFRETWHPIKWLAQRLSESKEHRHLRKETTLAVATEHAQLKDELANSQQCHEITQQVADNYREYLQSSAQPIPEPVFTTKQIVQLEIQAIREPDLQARDRILSLITEAEASKHVFTPQAFDTKNLVPELAGADVAEHLSHGQEPTSFDLVTGQHATSVQIRPAEQSGPQTHPEITGQEMSPDIDAVL